MYTRVSVCLATENESSRPYLCTIRISPAHLNHSDDGEYAEETDDQCLDPREENVTGVEDRSVQTHHFHEILQRMSIECTVPKQSTQVTRCNKM